MVLDHTVRRRRLSMADRETVALLGTGGMGAAMGRRLLAAGLGVRAWNRTPERARPLADAGATVASSPAEAVRGAGIALTMLADGPAVEAVMTGPDGALAGLDEGALWIQASTIGVHETEGLQRLAAQQGVVFVDAPVLGTRQPAEEGRLTVLASGPDQARDRCAPVFDAIGNRTLWVGPAGNGTKLKLVANTWLNGLLAGLAETIAMARAIGVDPALFLDAIEGGPMGSAYARLKGNLMISGEYPASFPVTLALKDVRLALEAAAEQGLDLEVVRTIAGLYETAIRLDHGGDDMAAIYEATRPDRAR
jgi:3-hydroxyisobutyrate dehydrogenase